jgi:hypothetical protein
VLVFNLTTLSMQILPKGTYPLFERAQEAQQALTASSVLTRTHTHTDESGVVQNKSAVGINVAVVREVSTDANSTTLREATLVNGTFARLAQND